MGGDTDRSEAVKTRLAALAALAIVLAWIGGLSWLIAAVAFRG